MIKEIISPLGEIAWNARAFALIKRDDNDINFNVKIKKLNVPVRWISIHLTEKQKKDYHAKYPEDGNYFLCTNLDEDYSIENFVNLYHGRWFVETHIRYSKYDLTLSEIKSKTLENLEQYKLVHNFILIFTGYIYMLLSKLNKKVNQKISYSNVILQLCDNTFLNIFLLW